MLLELEKYSDALDKAVESGNTDLISFVIVKMQRKMSLKDFQMEVRRDPIVYSLYKKHCKEQNEEALINIYRQEDDNNEIAACHVKNACNPEVCIRLVRFIMCNMYNIVTVRFKF